MRYTGTTLTGNTQIDKSLLDLLNKINSLSEADVLTLRGVDANGKQILSSMSWNKEAGTVDVTLQNGVTGQMFQELHIYAEASEDILNGQVVQFTGASTTSNMIKVGVANTNTPSPVTGFYDPATVIGVATQDIKFGKLGYITWFGSVRTLDTTMWNEGDLLYLDADNPGKLTSTYPAAGQKWVNLGIVQSKGFTDGEIFVRPVFGDNLSQVTLDPTGFDTPENITMTYNSGARTVTLTGAFQGYWQGNIIPVLHNSWTSDPHPVGITQSYFLYYNKTNGFSWSTTPWQFTDLMIAFIAADAGGAKFAIRECHGTMPWRVHQELHQTIGTYLLSGGDISNVTLNSTTLKQPYVSTTQIKDEDNISTEPALNTASYTLAYLTSTGTINFTLASGNFVPVSGNNPYYNLFTGGNWTQSLVLNNSYMTVWLVAMPVTADAGSQSYRYMWVQGQSTGDLASQQILSSSSLSLGNLANLANELVFLNKIILRYTASNWSVTQIDKLTGTRIVQTSFAAGNYLSSVTTDTTLSGIGTASSPLSVLSVPAARVAAGSLPTGVNPFMIAKPGTGGPYAVTLNGTNGEANSALYSDSTLNYSTAGILAATGFSGNGSALTSVSAANLSTNRTNWVTNGTISAVVGQLGWKNYGNNHTIFDASGSLSPSGSAIGNTDPAAAWTGTYPTLMGWNGTSTYGVRVDIAKKAETISRADTSVNSSVAYTYPSMEVWEVRRVVNTGGAAIQITTPGTSTDGRYYVWAVSTGGGSPSPGGKIAGSNLSVGATHFIMRIA